MKPQTKLAETTTPDGARLALFEHDGAYAIRLNGQGLMDSRATASELALGEVGTKNCFANPKACVLIGGLGLGFTLRSVLEHVVSTVEVHVVELLHTVVEWNREHLVTLNGALLDDPRVTVSTEDIAAVLAGLSPQTYDAILLDIDNGPSAMVQNNNNRLYRESGLRLLAAALRPRGRLVIWSAGQDPSFAGRLQRVGFTVDAVPAKRYPGARKAAITLYVADKR